MVTWVVEQQHKESTQNNINESLIDRKLVAGFEGINKCKSESHDKRNPGHKRWGQRVNIWELWVANKTNGPQNKHLYSRIECKAEKFIKCRILREVWSSAKVASASFAGDASKQVEDYGSNESDCQTVERDWVNQTK